MDELTEQRRKLTTAMRAQRRLERRLDDITWEREVLQPAVKRLEAAMTAGKPIKITAPTPENLHVLSIGD